MKYKFLNVVKRDLIFGFKNNRNKLVSIFVLLIVLTYFIVLSIRGQAFELGLDSKNINFIDLFFYMFKFFIKILFELCFYCYLYL